MSGLTGRATIFWDPEVGAPRGAEQLGCGGSVTRVHPCQRSLRVGVPSQKGVRSPGRLPVPVSLGEKPRTKK